jgi:hypothetical protein
LTVRDSPTGDLIYRQQIGTGTQTYSASAIEAGGHIYFVSEHGDVTVIEVGSTFRKTAGNDKANVVIATPAVPNAGAADGIPFDVEPFGCVQLEVNCHALPT